MIPLMDDIPTFHGKPELYCDWILKLENKATVTKCNSKQLGLEKVHSTVTKCLQSLQVSSVGTMLNQI